MINLYLILIVVFETKLDLAGTGTFGDQKCKTILSIYIPKSVKKKNKNE